MSDDSRILRIACQLIVFILYPISRVRLLLWPYTNPGTDLDVYFDYVQRAAAGQVPYRDFIVEYPPAAWFVIRAPGATGWIEYARRFTWIGTSLEIAAFGVFLLAARAVSQRRFWPAAATYVIVTTLLREFLWTRLDTGLLLLLMIWAWLVLTSAPGSSDSKRTLSYVVLGLATAFKVAPLVMLPFALAHHWRKEHGGIRWSLAVWFAVGVAAPFLLMAPTAGLAPLGFLRYHLDRGLEVESIGATLAWATRWMGQPVAAVQARHAFELTGPGTAAIAQLSTIASAGVVAACFAAEIARPWRGAAIVAGAIALAAFVIVSKVLSPQYFFWLLPLFSLAGMDAWTSDRAHLAWCAALLAIASLTHLIYPTFFLAVVNLQPLGFFLLLSRNALVAVVVIGLALRVWRR